MWTSAVAKVKPRFLLSSSIHPLLKEANHQRSYSVLSALRSKQQANYVPLHVACANMVSTRCIYSEHPWDDSKLLSKTKPAPAIAFSHEINNDGSKCDSELVHLACESQTDPSRGESLSAPLPSAPPQSDPPAPSDDRLPVERGRAGGAPVRTRGLAPFVAASADLRRLLALGVDVSGWDRRPGIPQLVLRLQWERDMAPRIRFLHDAGVPSDRLAAFITRNPLIFKERLDDLRVRVNYLEAKRFTREQISSVLSRDPFWLMFSTARIDRRLGLYAGLFGLRATELRQLAAKCPDLITSNVQHVKDSLFTIKEEFGFERAELKQILLGKPKVFMLSRWALQDRLQYLHNEMGLTHELIAESPNVLTYRSWRVRQRHLMLNMLRRDQYDRSRPGYVNLDRLVGTTDEEFCRDVAQVPVASYNEFLKTL